MATAIWFGKALEGQYGTTAARRVDWVTDTIKEALVTSSWTPDQDANDFWDDVSANEVANGAGYTTGGATLASKSVTYTGGTNKVALIAADVVWTGLTKAFRYGVYYKDTGSASTSPVLGYVDFGAQSVSGVDFTSDHDPTNGIFSITAS